MVTATAGAIRAASSAILVSSIAWRLGYQKLSHYSKISLMFLGVEKYLYLGRSVALFFSLRRTGNFYVVDECIALGCKLIKVCFALCVWIAVSYIGKDNHLVFVLICVTLSIDASLSRFHYVLSW